MELPVLGKYYFRQQRRRWRPFAETGYSFQRSWSESAGRTVFRRIDTGEIISTASRFPDPASWNLGAAFGGGLLWNHRRFGLAPEFRYIRWGETFVNRNRNQAEFILGIRF